MAVDRKRYDKTSAQNAGLDYLLRRATRLDNRSTEPLSDSASDGFAGPIESSVFVASVDASAAIRQVADYICDGVDDQDEINAAIEHLNTLDPAEGELRLSSGRFTCTAELSNLNGINIVGDGSTSTQIIIDLSSIDNTVTFCEMGTSASIRHLYVTVTGSGSFTNQNTYLFNASNDSSFFDVQINQSLMFTHSGPYEYGIRTGAYGRVLSCYGQFNISLAGGSGYAAYCRFYQVHVAGGTERVSHCHIASTLDVDAGEFEIDNCIINAVEWAGNLGRISNCRLWKITGAGTGMWIQGCELTGTTVISTTAHIYGTKFVNVTVEDDVIMTGCEVTQTLTVSGTADTPTDDGLIQSNTIGRGMLLDGAGGMRIEENLIIGLTAGQGDAIKLANGADENYISENTFVPDVGFDGINISTSDCTDNVLGFNILRGTENYLTDSGTGTRQPKLINLAYADSSDPLTTKTGQQPWILTEPGEVVDVRCVVDTAPTDASIIVDVNINGASLWSASGLQPDILTTATDSDLHAPDQNAAYVDGDVVTIDIDQVGSTIAGSNLTVIIRVRPTF